MALCGHVARPVAGSGSRIEDYGALMQGVGEPCMDVWEADAPDDVQGLRSKGRRWTRTARVADGSGHLRVRSSFPNVASAGGPTSSTLSTPECRSKQCSRALPACGVERTAGRLSFECAP